MKSVTINQRGTITLPKKMRQDLWLIEGASLRISNKGSKITLEPVSDFDAQLMQDIKEGLEDTKKGNFIEFGSIEELHTKLGIDEGQTFL